MAKTARKTNFTKFYSWREKRSKRASVSPQSNKNFSSYVKILSNKYGNNSKNNKFNRILHLEREKGKESLEIWQNTTNWLE